MATTYTKLRDGSWGIRSTDRIRAGQSVTVRKQNGETKTETVGKVLWNGEGVTLATIEQSRTQKSYSKRQYPRTDCSCGSRDGIIQDSDCWTCKHDAE